MITTLLSNLVANANMEDVLNNSIKDYHVKGFDYINLHRSPDLTVKLYFFDDVITDMSEVVRPHDHFYDFETYVMNGQFTDYTFDYSENGNFYNRYNYFSPLRKENAGQSGIVQVDQVRLSCTAENIRNAGGQFFHKAEDFHTIRINEPGTVLCLLQYRNKNLRHTTLFSKDEVDYSDKGLYTNFKADDINRRLGQLNIGRID